MRVERVQHSHATAEDCMLTSMSRVGHTPTSNDALCTEIWNVLINPKKCRGENHIAMMSYLEEEGLETSAEMSVIASDAEVVDKLCSFLKNTWSKAVRANFEKLRGI
jgi:hypothetical protein